MEDTRAGTVAPNAPTPSGGNPLDAVIVNAARQYNIPPEVLRALLTRESGLNPNGPPGAAGEIGVAQMMPGTAAMLGVDPKDPAQAILGAAHYVRMNMNRFGGDLASGLAAYNWGPGNVAKYGLANAPPQVKAYVAGILGNKGAPMSGGAGVGAGGGPATATPTQAVPLAQTPAPAPQPQPGPMLAQQGQNDLASIFAAPVQNFQKQTNQRIFGLA